MTTTASGLDGLAALAGADLGHTGWLERSQRRVDTFADATGTTSGTTLIRPAPRPGRSAGRSRMGI